MAYIVSQVIICLAYVFAGATMIVKDRKKILFCNLTATVFFTISYILLFAWSGVAMNMVSIIRNIVFFLITKYTANSKKSRLYEFYGLLFIYALAIICSIFTYEGILSLMPIFAALIFTYCIWQKNNTVYKILAIVSSLLWIIYNAYINAIMGVVLESLMIICGIIGFIRNARLVKKEKEETENKLEQQKDINAQKNVENN